MSSKKSLARIVKILSANEFIKNCLRYNLFTHDIEIQERPEWSKFLSPGDILDNEALIDIRYYLETVCELEADSRLVSDACYILASRNTYHPVKEYIEKEKWDGIKRLDEWLIHTVGCEDNIYNQLAGKRLLIAAVNRVYNPGCKFDHMMILEGPQGIGKSTMIEELAGNFYIDVSFEHKDKDLVDTMRQGMLIEVSELTGMNKKEIDWLKSFITRKTDVIRLPYAHRSKPFKRNCVFIGTYNPSGNNTYLNDDTGNRRFWPIECRVINLEYIKENKHQLWAEALECFKAKEPYYIFEEEAIKIMLDIHAEREIESPTHTRIKEWLKIKFDEVSMTEIIEDCLKINMSGKHPKEMLSLQTTVGIIMKKIGWRKGKNENRNKYFKPGDHKPLELQESFDE